MKSDNRQFHHIYREDVKKDMALNYFSCFFARIIILILTHFLSFAQVHTFYEAVGYMIGAQTDQAVQEHLIEKYMLLPNQVWDSIIQQATKVKDQ